MSMSLQKLAQINVCGPNSLFQGVIFCMPDSLFLLGIRKSPYRDTRLEQGQGPLRWKQSPSMHGRAPMPAVV
jgi:hypothetical protein